MEEPQLAALNPAFTSPTCPFCPPLDPNLTLGETKTGHQVILNKFPVLESHLLAISNTHEDQESYLGPEDFAAATEVLGEEDGLIFFNAGRHAGASQPHKHVQVVKTGQLPLAAWLARGPSGRPRLPYRHALAPLDASAFQEGVAGPLLFATYARLLAQSGVATTTVQPGIIQEAPYNLLLTRQWMIIVPRTTERAAMDIPINALGFAGIILLRDESQEQLVCSQGALSLLTATSFAPSH
jgi:ATP adenylyltransferase